MLSGQRLLVFLALLIALSSLRLAVCGLPDSFKARDEPDIVSLRCRDSDSRSWNKNGSSDTSCIVLSRAERSILDLFRALCNFLESFL